MAANDDKAGKRRGRGEGSLYWSQARQRWIAELTTGYTPAGKRIYRSASDKNKTTAGKKLRDMVRDYEAGLPVASQSYTVAEAVDDWLTYGLPSRSSNSIATYTSLCSNHITPDLGARKLVRLSADDVDKWLEVKARSLATTTLRRLHQTLSRIVDRAMARDRIKRNVVDLCSVPTGQPGRPSKSLTYPQATAVLDAAEGDPLEAYIAISLLTGARTEEMRALDWDHTDLDGKPDEDEPVPPSIDVFRSVREGGDTKTKKSRRSLALPQRAVIALRNHRHLQDAARERAGDSWQETGLVFTTPTGAPLGPHHVERGFRRVVRKAGLNPEEWVPRELRHSFVSLLSDHGLSLDDIAKLCGHTTQVTETVYRHQLRPVLLSGTVAMDRIFAADSVAKPNSDRRTGRRADRRAS